MSQNNKSYTHIDDEAFCGRICRGYVTPDGEALRAVGCHRTPVNSATEPSSSMCVPDTLNKSFFTSKDNIFPLNDSVQINFGTASSRDFYKLLVQFQDSHL